MEVEALGREAIAFQADVCDADHCKAMVAATKERFGALHVAFLNAGIGVHRPEFEIRLDEWDTTMNVDLRGVLIGLQAMGRAILDSGGGSVVITSSGAGICGEPNIGSYAAAEHGVLGLMKCAAVE